MMIISEKTINGRECFIATQDDPEFLLIQSVDEHDMSTLQNELDLIERGTDARFAFTAFRVHDWNKDLSPWEAPAVYGDEPFGSGAEDTLSFVQDELIPFDRGKLGLPRDVRVIIGGYSLAALFALWAALRTDYFYAAACASPSVWFPGWMEYARERLEYARERLESAGDAGRMCGRIYLSLGTKEEKTRHPVMSRVGDNIRELASMLEECCGEGKSVIGTTLEWNPGNHFREPDVRTAKGFCWCME